jgi:hypothetical protein
MQKEKTSNSIRKKNMERDKKNDFVTGPKCVGP